MKDEQAFRKCRLEIRSSWGLAEDKGGKEAGGFPGNGVDTDHSVHKESERGLNNPRSRPSCERIDKNDVTKMERQFLQKQGRINKKSWFKEPGSYFLFLFSHFLDHLSLLRSKFKALHRKPNCIFILWIQVCQNKKCWGKRWGKPAENFVCESASSRSPLAILRQALTSRQIHILQKGCMC